MLVGAQTGTRNRNFTTSKKTKEVINMNYSSEIKNWMPDKNM